MRHIGTTYQQKKGQGFTKVNQLQSSLGAVLSHEVARKHVEHPRHNITDRLNSAGNLINWLPASELETAYRQASKSN